MTGPDLQTLEVHMGRRGKVGTIALPVGSVSDFEFNYDPRWIATGFPVSPHLPFHEEIPARNVRNFLENLLPEGKGLDELLDNTTISRGNVFALIRRIGTETAGALSFVAPEHQPEPTSFRVITDEEMAEHLKHSNAITCWDGRTRLSVAGVQDKLNILEKDGRFGFGEGDLCSNYIYKFETGRVPHIVVNEAFVMSLARHAGLAAANTRVTTFGDVRTLVVERFDRRLVPAGTAVLRRHIIDGCQAVNLPSSYKYERQNGDEPDVATAYRDGVSFPKLFAVKTSNQPAYHRQLVEWLLFNILNSNMDAHGKNISFFVGRDGLTLAPFYDLVNIEALQREADRRNSRSELGETGRESSTPRFYAMSVGGYEPNTAGNFESPITAYMLADFAITFEISLPRMQLLAQQMVQRVQEAVPAALAEVLALELSDSEREHLSSCQELVETACEELLEEAEQIPEMAEYL